MSDGIPDTNFNEKGITNDYMFTTVMQDPRLCIELLKYLLPDNRIQRLKYIQFNRLLSRGKFRCLLAGFYVCFTKSAPRKFFLYQPSGIFPQ